MAECSLSIIDRAVSRPSHQLRRHPSVFLIQGIRIRVIGHDPDQGECGYLFEPHLVVRADAEGACGTNVVARRRNIDDEATGKKVVAQFTSMTAVVNENVRERRRRVPDIADLFRTNAESVVLNR